MLEIQTSARKVITKHLSVTFVAEQMQNTLYNDSESSQGKMVSTLNSGDLL